MGKIIACFVWFDYGIYIAVCCGYVWIGEFLPVFFDFPVNALLM